MQKEYINEASWSQIMLFFRQRNDIYIGCEKTFKRFIEAVLWITRTGTQWRQLPLEYGNWNTVYVRFNEWSKKNIWTDFFESCKQLPDLEYVMIDSTIIRANACAAGYGTQEQQALGRSVGGFTTKIHVVADALGNLLKFSITQGKQHDITQASGLLKEYKNAYVLADKGYDSQALREQLTNQDCIPTIPSKSNSLSPCRYDKHIYKERHLVECLISKIKFFRRVFSRFDKTARNYTAFISLVGAILWLR